MKSMAALLVAAVALGLFGCGGSSGSSLTKAEFTKQANQACKRANEERLEVLEGKTKALKIEPGDVPTPSQEKQIVFAAIAAYEGATEKLKELVPSDQEEAILPLIEVREELAKKVRQNATSSPTELPYKKANLLASRYGLDECTV